MGHAPDHRCEMLTKLGYENLCEAQDGREAMEILRRRGSSTSWCSTSRSPTWTAFDVLGALKADPALCHLPVIVALGTEPAPTPW